jgi:hypothetical protein
MRTPRKRELAIERSRAQARLIVKADIQPGQMSPLNYLLMVINDSTADSDRRDRLAIAAAPYCHPRLTDARRPSKKDRQNKEAAAAGAGTPWVDDLESEIRAN